MNDLWTDHGTFPVNGRPKLRKVYGSSPSARTQGYSLQIPFLELTTADRDGDGLLDVQLDTGQWVGYDTASGTWRVK